MARLNFVRDAVMRLDLKLHSRRENHSFGSLAIKVGGLNVSKLTSFLLGDDIIVVYVGVKKYLLRVKAEVTNVISMFSADVVSRLTFSIKYLLAYVDDQTKRTTRPKDRKATRYFLFSFYLTASIVYIHNWQHGRS